MRSSFWLNTVGYLLLLFGATACSRTPHPQRVLTRQEMREDLTFLDKKLQDWYPGLGYYGSGHTYRQTRDSLLEHLPGTLSYLDFFHEVAPLISGQKDGHLNVSPPRRYLTKRTSYLPFAVRQVAGKYFIALNASTDSTFRRGAELLAVEGHPMAQLHEMFADHFRDGADADIPSGRYYRNLIAFPSSYVKWFGAKDSLWVRYVPGDSSQVTDTLETYVKTQPVKLSNSVLKARYPADLQSAGNLSVTHLDSTLHVAVLRVSTFSKFKNGDPYNLKFKRKLRQAFRKIQQQDYDTLVIDLRGNGGGAIVNSARLLAYLLPKPFSVFKESTIKPKAVWPYVTMPPNLLSPIVFFATHFRDPETGLWRTRASARKVVKPDRRYPYRGKLYFLVNGATFSASVSVLAHAKNQGIGILVGEPPGGAYWGDFASRFRVIQLPHSKIRVRIPLKTLYHDVKPETAIEITPDFPIHRTYRDIITPGRDYGLEYIKSLIRSGK